MPMGNADPLLAAQVLGLATQLADTRYLLEAVTWRAARAMGLAPYGDPEVHRAAMRDLLRLDGLFELNLDYFVHQVRGAEMTWAAGSPVLGRLFSPRLEQAFGQPRKPGEVLNRRIERLIEVQIDPAVVPLGEPQKAVHEKRRFLTSRAGAAADRFAAGARRLVELSPRRLVLQTHRSRLERDDLNVQPVCVLGFECERRLGVPHPDRAIDVRMRAQRPDAVRHRPAQDLPAACV